MPEDVAKELPSAEVLGQAGWQGGSPASAHQDPLLLESPHKHEPYFFLNFEPQSLA